MGKLAQQLSGQSQVKCFAKGGAAKRDDAAMDVAQIKKMVKPAALKACGGKVKAKKK
jgi:hypothetical protein